MLKDIEAAGNVPSAYCTTANSFLHSCVQLLTKAPVTLLCEYFNQRDIDVISQEVLPTFPPEESVGIITPYRMQAESLNTQLHTDIASTVHKYQGRECNTIIMSMVDNTPTEFSDNSDLLNVAISRAKSHFNIVLTGNDLNPDSNLSQLVDYIRYHNYEIEESTLQSVFDLLYKPYTEERFAFATQHPTHQISDELSENLVYDLLKKAQLQRDALKNHILEVSGLRLIRLSTVMTLNEDTLKEMLEN